MRGPPVFSIEVLNFALVTYRVPAARVLRRLPDAYDLDTHREGDEPYCFITTTCFCNQDYRPALLPYPRLTFDESTYRTYVSHKGRSGVYFFGRYLSRPAATLSQRTLAKDTWDADFSVAVDAVAEGYRSYSCHATSKRGETSFAIDALSSPQSQLPFETADDLVQFFTFRLHGFFTSSLGAQGHMPVSHPRMNPRAGTLSAARFDLWATLDVLDEDEAQTPYSVLVVPEVPFTLYSPQPL